MKLFLSWSGLRSHKVAQTLRQWIPDIIQAVEPWMSSTDIDAGARWNHEIADQLSNTRVGIICLTQQNQRAPWLLFEAGALAKTIADTYVCPFLIDLSPPDVLQGPLTQFQSKVADEQGAWELIQTINRALKEEALPPDRLQRGFQRFWPDLKCVLDDLPDEDPVPGTSRPLPDMVSEILELTRGMSRRMQSDVPARERPQMILHTLAGGEKLRTPHHFDYMLDWFAAPPRSTEELYVQLRERLKQQKSLWEELELWQESSGERDKRSNEEPEPGSASGDEEP